MPFTPASTSTLTARFFTPESFVDLMSGLALLDMAHFTVKSFHPTVPYEHEFLTVLEKLPDEVALHFSREDRQNYVLDRLPKLPKLPKIPGIPRMAAQH